MTGSNQVRLSAAAVAAPVTDLLRHSLRASVLASFHRSCYLETSAGAIIAVLSGSLDRSPFGISVEGDSSFDHLRPMDEVRCDGSLLFMGSLSLDLSRAQRWNPRLPSLAGSAERSLAALKAWLRRKAPEEGLAGALDTRHNSYLLNQARAGLKRLRLGLENGSETTIKEGTARLAGLGPGLTPSGDDMLAGILIALYLWPDISRRLGPQLVSRLVAEEASGRTGTISRAYLEAARRGEASAAWHELVRLLPAGEDRSLDAAARIFQTGETSGADMLAGFVFAYKIRARMPTAVPIPRW